MNRHHETSSTRERVSSPDVVKGALAGMAGGLVASWVMNRLQQVVQDAGADEVARPGAGRAFAPPIAEEQIAPTTYSSSAPKLYLDGEVPAPKPTVRMANRISKTFLKHEIPDERRETAGAAVHYAFGTLVGGLYGAAAEVSPRVVPRFGGMPFGMALWLIAEEIALPAFRLSDPRKVPVKRHATDLASHFVYGATADGVRRLLRGTAIH